MRVCRPTVVLADQFRVVPVGSGWLSGFSVSTSHPALRGGQFPRIPDALRRADRLVFLLSDEPRVLG